ncbi:PTS lactose transporter subunit IIB [Virgibacillus pantothenticus]|uniref:PTS sugar transporter subunit IIB n=1 Tax=Virgibacillus pantothenticus TaxID=1473 RepID=UPI001B291F85|nr:PTS sugar transporter subunit IIB [Virgibacillus pantothenticus]MBU8568574.1 PTS sugar transporter subunit IIB [Virgibacillus pantothenticus]MBU8602598.1 PTS sugar transporter subunit IIB [Virgibacillus pantothenticus]MBU8636718.1 PTS sugar transporter subunit IIB [Virgibacillus pantothenticus]MBU8644397.1 PTS sugar transporter subunit IIB [Virgibacillus pantothenticus]MBU8648524.1 PTS sugar transporter subunit IIB [Virgibacillus pantothenticus]
MEIITVCGMGFGTSLMLKMMVDDILEKEGIKAEVSALDAGSAKGRNADLIMASADLESALEGVEVSKIFIHNLTDADEVEQKLHDYLQKIHE